MADLEELLQIAVTVAGSAGDLLIDGLDRDRTSVRTKSSRTDMVTEMDLASEKLIADSLHRLRPRDSMVGEEGARRDGSTEVRWIVDPLDGTTNYLHRWPAFAVSIAAEVAGRVAVGVVHDPSREETFAAVRGGGARLSRPGSLPSRPLHVDTPPPELDEALVGTGFNYDARLRAQQAAVLTRVLPAVRDIRRAGAAALDLCWVAAGRIDAFFEAGLEPWDWSAGALIAGESGAWVGDLAGGPPSRSMTIAAAPELASRLRTLLVESGGASVVVDDTG